MPHPLLGLPPSDPTAGHADAAARLRAGRDRLADLSLAAALRLDRTIGERYDELMLRRFRRDYEQHIEQLARALETGEARFVVTYAESIIPAYRRRGVRMNDVVTLVTGLREAAQTALSTDETDALRALTTAWVARLRHHARLPGDHAGNRLVRFIWKGAGLGDDTVV